MSRCSTYSSLLEKYPAVALSAGPVVTDAETGASMRRRTNAYTFDQDLFAHWSNGGGVWIEDDPEDHDNNPAPLLQKMKQTMTFPCLRIYDLMIITHYVCV